MPDFIAQCAEALAEGTPYPSFSSSGQTTTIDHAYAIQHLFVSNQDREISGYKAALTAFSAQQAMGIDAPVTGVLFADGARSNGDTVSVPNGGVLETELGFILAQEIVTPVTEDSVLEKMAGCAPMIEVAKPNLSGPLNGLDLIATNAASFCYIQGEGFDPLITEADDIQVSLSAAKESLFAGQANEVMGGQRLALTWLINALLALDYPLSQGHLLMTGAIGGAAPAKPGDYAGLFSGHSTLKFRISS